ncbi:MAG: flagellar basal body rod C-terminal domain-containing protein, partial [Methylococcaceae bacterium]
NVKNMKPGDYQLKYEKGDFDEFGSYTITRTSDNAVFSTLDGTLTPDEDGGFTVDEIKIKIAGSETLTNGDTFTIKAPSEDFGGIADNSNMIALGQLQTQGSLDNGAYSFHQVYTQMVTSIGGKTRTASIDTQAHETFLKQLTTQRENISGVNLDEEAANLLKYQQAYQAAAQIIPIANSMFDTLISAVR